MKLYWSSRSPYVRKVMIVAHETGVADRIEKISVLVSGMSPPNPAVMRDNPLNKIPTLITDEGVTLFESAMICEYLDSLHAGPRLFPAEPALRWPALRWHALGHATLDAEMAWRAEKRRPSQQQAPVALQAYELKLQSALALLGGEVGALGAAPFSIGHIGVACALAYLDFRFADFDWRAGQPCLGAWFDELSKRACLRATAFIDA